MNLETRRQASGGIPPGHLLFALFALFAWTNALVPAFLGKPVLVAACMMAAVAVLGLLWFGERRAAPLATVSWQTFGICLAIACALLLLGGEGRLFYANEDWQIRDAVLADMARHPWPFAYRGLAGDQVLRAPLGMYLLPALIGQNSQLATDLALLGCNTLVVGALLALASTLFTTARARRIALTVFLAFSGLDIVGTAIARLVGSASLDHLERWAPPLQYSSVITLIFWVPQHAIAGWFCALLYLLHRRGGATLGSLAASVPLAAIWSPLAAMGAVPFVALAGVRSLRAGALRWSDVFMGAAALVLAVPALLYLAADAQRLPAGLRSVPFLTLAMFLLLEVLPTLWILYRLRLPHGIGLDTLVLTVAMLVVIPLFHIGGGEDFVMRASIVPLALLAAMLAVALAGATRIPRPIGVAIALLLSFGAVTGAAEAVRALRLAPAPPPLCNLPGAWVRQSGGIADISTYLARIEAVPRFLRPDAPAIIGSPKSPDRCWSRAWRVPRFG